MFGNKENQDKVRGYDLVNILSAHIKDTAHISLVPRNADFYDEVLETLFEFIQGGNVDNC